MPPIPFELCVISTVIGMCITAYFVLLYKNKKFTVQNITSILVGGLWLYSIFSNIDVPSLFDIIWSGAVWSLLWFNGAEIIKKVLESKITIWKK